MSVTPVRLSIITPAFNAARYLQACVENVAGQGIAGVEHLVVDGGSADGSVALLERLSATHSALRWVSESDRGQSDALNKGAALARGALIGVLNADDHYEPGVLRRVVELFAASPDLDLLVGACNVRDGEGRLVYVNRPRFLSASAILMGFEFPVNPAAYFYRMALHDRAGGFDVDDHYSMDLDFLLRAVRVGRYRYINEIWGNFVMWPGAKTTQDKGSGRARARVAAVRRRHLATLSGPDRVLVRAARPWVVLQRKLVNTLKRPRETLARYANALRRLLDASAEG
jgi:glycosyltransferase involved in cell wall biosynthesis